MPYPLMDMRQAIPGNVGTISRGRNVPDRRARSGGMFDAHGMVRDVFVQIREDEQELEHTIALFGLGLVGTFFQAVFGEWGSLAAARQSLIGAQKRFVEKMIQAQLRAGECRRRRLRASRTGTMDGNNGCHPTPLILERLRPRG
jgi:hypothetical protein